MIEWFTIVTFTYYLFFFKHLFHAKIQQSRKSYNNPLEKKSCELIPRRKLLQSGRLMEITLAGKKTQESKKALSRSGLRSCINR
jgi:hypothetical protein